MREIVCMYIIFTVSDITGSTDLSLGKPVENRINRLNRRLNRSVYLLVISKNRRINRFNRLNRSVYPAVKPVKPRLNRLNRFSIGFCQPVANRLKNYPV